MPVEFEDCTPGNLGYECTDAGYGTLMKKYVTGSDAIVDLNMIFGRGQSGEKLATSSRCLRTVAAILCDRLGHF